MINFELMTEKILNTTQMLQDLNYFIWNQIANFETKLFQTNLNKFEQL